MNIKIQLSNSATKAINQQFFFFTEAHWELQKTRFSKNLQQQFSAKKNETFVVADDAGLCYLIGLGANPKPFDLQAVASKFAYDFRKKIQPQITEINSGFFSDIELEFLLTGLFLGVYTYPFKVEHPFFNSEFSLTIKEKTQEYLSEISTKILALCKGQFISMEWLNKPQNQKKVVAISAFLEQISNEYHFKRTVFNKEKCEALGLGAFLSVNQGSSQEAAFTILEYQSENKNAKTIGLVGKCVLFDTGGISIKPADNLHYMKSDLGGATAVIGTLIAAAEMKLPVNIIAVLPITDNAISNNSYLPSDVVSAYNGKTIEVLNTDAEGRMTLADGLSYLAKNYKTDALLDLATLTGSAVRMFGYTCAAYFSNNENLKKTLETSADTTNQRIWNLPLWQVWEDDFQSDVADFKNISSKPFGDCIVAAKFLEQFIEDHHNWAHLDIAGVAFGNVQYMKEKGATGYGVQLLIDFLENF